MYYTNKETFVLSADGCMDTERGGLESILAGNDEGAKGCCFSVAMSADGIAVLSSDGCAAAPDGTRLPVSDYSYAELHQAAPQLTPVSQAIELARTCQGKIAITVHDQTMLRQLRMTLRYADYLDDTIIIGLGLVEAAHLRNCEDTNCSEGTCSNRKNFSVCDVSTNLCVGCALQTEECDIARNDVTFQSSVCNFDWK